MRAARRARCGRHGGPGAGGTVARGGVVRDDAVMSATRAASAELQDPGPGFQRRVLTVLALGQVLGGLGTGATLALGHC